MWISMIWAYFTLALVGAVTTGGNAEFTMTCRRSTSTSMSTSSVNSTQSLIQMTTSQAGSAMSHTATSTSQLRLTSIAAQLTTIRTPKQSTIIVNSAVLRSTSVWSTAGIIQQLTTNINSMAPMPTTSVTLTSRIKSVAPTSTTQSVTAPQMSTINHINSITPQSASNNLKTITQAVISIAPHLNSSVKAASTEQAITIISSSSLVTISPPKVEPTMIVEVTLPGYTADTFKESVQTMFQEATAAVINAYCSQDPQNCQDSTRARRQANQLVIVSAEDIIITNIQDNKQGVLTFQIHIQLERGFLMASDLQEAIEGGTEVYAVAGFDNVSSQLVVPVSTESLSIGAVAGIVVGVFTLTVICCGVLIISCKYGRGHKKKTIQFNTYGLQNPFAEGDTSTTALTRYQACDTITDVEKEDITVQAVNTEL